ncbi:MAG: 30S ribosomal protein S11 [Candidatus Rehaiarchaeum fermentans]|nr:30S ribosomal protein S11 [Candidatus Rehaiarchaeum fermentans]MCW1293338.1 30S ribosomal protein S11 [Candidatus Rehaiarchaeum fermentans]MCW1297351.1 30S ribosomal protein S11 [Candidatus Rehaiarchaeum fermentans]MCW1302148.1 30S ribosomal protein S11 [Candidatus Rehaiarchaeum fermentans]MCW1311379.1 30S ribosomal protein S11 [Candidatus Rehaiarchaeum fermentans]
MESKVHKGLIHIYASANNTFIHLTDLTGAYTFELKTSGQKASADRFGSAPKPTMLAAKEVAQEALDRGIKEVYIRIRAPGGIKSKNLGPGYKPAIIGLQRAGLKILNIENVTPIPHGGCKPKGGRKGRRM